ncbi:hypothetical protein [Ferruginibacter sp.]
MKPILILFLSYFIVLDTASQVDSSYMKEKRGVEKNKKSSRLIVFFKENFDSTIIYSSSEPNYFIVSKEKDNVYFFTYLNPIKKNVLGRHYPGELALWLLKENSKFGNTEPDTNRYFLPFVTKINKQVKWKELQQNGIWQIEDYRSENSDRTDDGGMVSFFLITKTEVKHFEYYSIGDWNDSDKKNKVTKSVLKSNLLFKEIFK